jgi:hypothetical protein
MHFSIETPDQHSENTMSIHSLLGHQNEKAPIRRQGLGEVVCLLKS